MCAKIVRWLLILSLEQIHSVFECLERFREEGRGPCRAAAAAMPDARFDEK